MRKCWFCIVTLKGGQYMEYNGGYMVIWLHWFLNQTQSPARPLFTNRNPAATSSVPESLSSHNSPWFWFIHLSAKFWYNRYKFIFHQLTTPSCSQWTTQLNFCSWTSVNWCKLKAMTFPEHTLYYLSFSFEPHIGLLAFCNMSCTNWLKSDWLAQSLPWFLCGLLFLFSY